MEKVKEVEAHSDFIRSLIVHPTEPICITSADDGTIKIWDYDKNFTLVRSLEEHKNFVMKIALNPKDPSMFASGSMDKKIKLWSITSPNSHITLEGHSQGVNTVAFCPLNDKPYLASGADDRTIKVLQF
jgi:coatomer subunit beta'